MLNVRNLTIKNLSAHKMSWGKQKKYAYPRPFNALSLRVKGQANFTHAGKTYFVKENDLVFVPKNYDYTLHSLKDESVIVIHFDSDVVFNDIITFSPKESEIILQLFSEIEKTYREEKIGFNYKMCSLFYQILEQIELQQKAEINSKNTVIEHFYKSINYLKTSFSNPEITISTLAKISGVSETYYRKLFARIFGVSPLKYINNLRLSQASSMLKTGYYSIEQVANQCGYTDSKYFTTSYKKLYGHPPGKDVPKIFKKI